MDGPTLIVPVPAWAKEELEHVHAQVRETLPETLQPFWDEGGFGLAGFDRQPLRPYLVLLVARHYGCTGPRPLRLAASMHMIHIASLLHDRLGFARRASGPGEDGGHELHQREALDILLGDFCFSEASRIIVEDGETRIIHEHIQTSRESAETQASLVNLAKKLEPVESTRVFELAGDKVSILLTLSLRVGAILGKAPREEEDALSEYGRLLGRMMRILEDLAFWEHLTDEASSLPPAARFSHPLLLLWEREGTEAWREAARELSVSDQRGWEALKARLDDRGYMAASRRVASGFAEQALRRLEGLAQPEIVRSLEAVVRCHGMPSGGRGEEVTH